MKNRIYIIVIMVISLAMPSKAYTSYNDNKPNEDVMIAGNAIAIPVGRILLIRKGAEYWAFKYTKYWIDEEEKANTYADYELYHQGEKPGDFSSDNVEKGELSRLKSWGFGHPFTFTPGNYDLEVGDNNLMWVGGDTLSFYGVGQDRGDYGIEMAPTIWTDISQVDIKDKRIRWYSFDPTRDDLFIPVDQLWDEKYLALTAPPVDTDSGKEVLITSDSITMPVGRIMLVRSDTEILYAIKFRKYWCEDDGRICFAYYDFFSRDNSWKDLSANNVEVNKFELLSWFKKYSEPPECIEYDGTKLSWAGGGTFLFKGEDGDTFEFAPTNWKDASEINITDSIKWYGYDESRKELVIPVGELGGK